MFEKKTLTHFALTGRNRRIVSECIVGGPERLLGNAGAEDPRKI